MKLLTLNFLTCARRTCKPLPLAFPLHIRDAELEAVELEFNPLFLRNVMGRLEWGALREVLGEVGLRLPGGMGGMGEGGESEESGEGAGEGIVEGEVAVESADTDVVMQGVEASSTATIRQEDLIASPADTPTRVAQQQQPPSQEISDSTLKTLHNLLMETQIVSGKLVCGNCGHEYAVREGIPNFLLPAHLV